MRILIFGTTYADNQDKIDLVHQWGMLHDRLNPGCDLLLVDSASPHRIAENFAPIFQLGDNIGHLSRGGRDGWGRAFCTGLQYAMDRSYDYVVHIEGDSLCSINVKDVCKAMYDTDVCVTSVPVLGTRTIEKNWVETGLMFFDVDFLSTSNIVGKYNWQNHSYKHYPQTPEYWLRHIIGNDLCLTTRWRTLRDDCGVLTKENVRDYQWITHTEPEIYDAFISA